MIALAKHKVLVIEDEPDLLEVIQYNLEREGHKVVACASSSAQRLPRSS